MWGAVLDVARSCRNATRSGALSEPDVTRRGRRDA